HTHTHTHTHTGALGRKQMHFIPKIHKELNHSLSVVTFRTLHLTLPLPTSDILPFSISLSFLLSLSLSLSVSLSLSLRGCLKWSRHQMYYLPNGDSDRASVVTAGK